MMYVSRCMEVYGSVWQCITNVWIWMNLNERIGLDRGIGLLIGHTGHVCQRSLSLPLLVFLLRQAPREKRPSCTSGHQGRFPNQTTCRARKEMPMAVLSTVYIPH